MTTNWATFSADVFASNINPPSPNSLQEQIQDIKDNFASITYDQWYTKIIQANAASNSTEIGYIDNLWGVVVYQLKQDPNFQHMDDMAIPYYVFFVNEPLNACTFYFALVDGTHPIPPLP